ncbi:MAG: DUF4332 domain-containing protein [Planctomycetaceae bacterium]
MSIQRAEQLKREWTDQSVMVREGIPELRRFEKLPGRVRTVNMNCRLLVEFETPADIGWYDIDPSFVTVVQRRDVTSTKVAATPHEKPSETSDATAKGSVSASATPPARESGAAKPSKSAMAGSPLDRIRQQAAGAGSTTGGGSALDRIRQQAAAKDRSPAAPHPGVAQPGGATANESQPPQEATSDSGSPLDRIRQQAAGAGPTTGSGSVLDRIRQQAAARDRSPADLQSGVTQSGGAAANESKPPQQAQEVPASEPAQTDLPTAPQSSVISHSQHGAPVSLFDQVATQIRDDEPELQSVEPNSQQTLFGQIQQQADRDDATGVSDTSLTSADQPATEKQSMESATSDSVGDSEVEGHEDPVELAFRGKKLPKKDDLKIVEGIGPKISELLNAAGITTWDELAVADPKRLQQILEDAGPRYRMHVPDTWPDQARLAASGQWKELEEFQELLDGGKVPEQS